MDDILLAISDNDSLYNEIIKTNLKERRIIINQEITDDLMESVVMMIIRWNTEDMNIDPIYRKRIVIYLNSDGGDVIMGSQILSIIKHSKTPVVTVGFAKCASMAAYILAAGQTRYCFPNTVVLYHDGQTGYVSSGNKGKDIQKFYDKLDERMAKFMIDNTNMTAEFIEEIKDREYYIFADTAKEQGIVDFIVGEDCDIDSIL